MRDERYMSQEDGREYEGSMPGRYEEYGEPTEQPQAYEERPARPARGERPVRPQRRPREAQPSPSGRSSKAAGALGNAAGAVADVFGGLAEKVRSLSANRAQGRLDIESDDYLGVGAPCRVCGNPVDRLQVKCPHCGARVRPLYKQATFWIAVAVAVVLVVVLSVSINSCKLQQASNSAATPSAASTSAFLQEAVTQAQATLDAQTTSHEYTRLSAHKLQDAVDAAQSALASGTASGQEISDASAALTEATAGLARTVDTSGYEWPYATDFTANMDSYVGKQIALTGTVAYVDQPADGSLGWSQITLSDGTALGIGVYASDCQSGLEVGKDVTVYGVLNTDGTTYAFWTDRVDVF